MSVFISSFHSCILVFAHLFLFAGCVILPACGAPAKETAGIPAPQTDRRTTVPEAAQQPMKQTQYQLRGDGDSARTDAVVILRRLVQVGISARIAEAAADRMVLVVAGSRLDASLMDSLLSPNHLLLGSPVYNDEALQNFWKDGLENEGFWIERSPVSGRLELWGTSEAKVREAGAQLARDTDSVVAVHAETKGLAENPEEKKYRLILISPEKGVTNRHVARADVFADETSRTLVVRLKFTEEGAALFESLTRANVKRELPISVDGHVVFLPIVLEPISAGETHVTTGADDTESAMWKANILAASFGLHPLKSRWRVERILPAAPGACDEI